MAKCNNSHFQFADIGCFLTDHCQNEKKTYSAKGELSRILDFLKKVALVGFNFFVHASTENREEQ